MTAGSGFQPQVLQNARLRNGWTQHKLAQILGVSIGSVKAWEQGRRTPLPHIQHQISQIFGIPQEQLSPDPAHDLAGLRRRVGKTLQTAAQVLGISTHTLRQVEAGRILPPDPKGMSLLYGVTAVVLADAFVLSRGAAGLLHRHGHEASTQPGD